eukprot:m51a1_g14819 putative signal recognition particle 72 kda (607) ;mRNA; f:632834-634944
MGDKKDKADPAQLFREIEALAQAGEHRRVAALSDRVLAQLPGDRDALLCKAVALAHLRRFDDALAAADACPAPGLPFERAYCLYRMRRNAEALDALAAAPAADRSAGQRVSRGPRSGSRRFSDRCDLAANDKVLAECEAGADTYELVYNAACQRAAQGRWPEALAALERARALMDPESTDAETAPLRALAGYVLHRLGEAARARDEYSAALHAKGADADVAAVAESNAAALAGGGDARHYAARALEAPEALQRMGQRQRCAVLANRCLALAAAPKPDAAAFAAAADAYERAGGAAHAAALMRAAMLARLQRPAEGAELLEAAARAAPAERQAASLLLAAAQLRAGLGDHAGAARALAALPRGLASRAGVAHAAAALLDRAGDREGAARALEGCADLLSASEGLRRRGLDARAARLIERAGSAAASTTDPRVIELLVANDPAAAAAYAGRLPAVALPPDSDADRLESRGLAQLRGCGAKDEARRKRKRLGLSVVHKKRNRPKRRPQAPREGARQPDPQRWVPKRERAAGKRRGKAARVQAAADAALRAGAQGMQNADEERKYETKKLSKAQMAEMARQHQEGARRKQLEEAGSSMTAGRRRVVKKKH